MQTSEAIITTDRSSLYQRRMVEIRGAFEAGGSGTGAIAARTSAMDELILNLWQDALPGNSILAAGVTVVAIGGYGRRELFPCSDVDLLFLLDAKVSEKEVKEPIRRICQKMWDTGIRVAQAIRRLAECERFSEDNSEFTFAIMDHRLLAGDATLYSRLANDVVPKLIEKDRNAILDRLLALTQERHAKYGSTLFHLEPNIKDCPGGLRDVHVCGWLSMLDGRGRTAADTTSEAFGFGQAVEFLRLVRCFLHYRHERDDNTLDWQAQDAAAAISVGVSDDRSQGVDAAYWMRVYFRHARSIERRLKREIEDLPPRKQPRRFSLKRDRVTDAGGAFRIERGKAILRSSPPAGSGEEDPAHDPEIVLEIFAAMARTDCTLERQSEERISHALGSISARLEEGPSLWTRLREILVGPYAGNALRAMHALGLLELLVPEFHGIDALVIRDAYHRYTVDEHTFVLIDTLHELQRADPAANQEKGSLADWAVRFGPLVRELPHPELLYLMALLHDTGKGRSTGDHAEESAGMARGLLARLELDPYESDLVLSLIENHLEMSSTLRRDIFDSETVRTFAGKVHTPELLRMLTLFTYADINAVHPDALTPWKAENLWRLYIATANYLDRSVDDERVGAQEARELVDRVSALVPDKRVAVADFLEGFPERYVLTRSPEQIRTHFRMAERLKQDRVQLDFRYAPAVSELTVVTPDRALLFANMTGALAAWGMNIVTADAFSNLNGIVVDSFRFTDTFRTLEMNHSEHERFVKSIYDVMTGAVPVEKLLSGRRRSRRKAPKVVVDPRVEFFEEASSHSTLVEVIAQDLPGLLRALSLTIAAGGHNIEVALVDTEGETAIDVFYLTHQTARLEKKQQKELRIALLEAMEENAR
ncbi:[protein-PII] uridylyltransferase [Edaphobacter sp. 12200R-103]|uniref:[protein-PII] uridylyltransferase n=1 Tax=Edaphobacter sp. 12200R-103 TaxID=2703788 RepID=UPI00138BA607|nr:[protein-PII] uridylyltransferase [Edaphobacter sp. 12200R-103]QHS51641.1 [protein-PII] uridylyltransferase [Edaphobacter sp. 12200R-103]